MLDKVQKIVNDFMILILFIIVLKNVPELRTHKNRMQPMNIFPAESEK